MPKSRRRKPKSKPRNRQHPSRSDHARHRTDNAEPDLIRDVREALNTGEPLPLLAFASTVLAVVDPRAISPLDRAQGAAPPEQGLTPLIESFIGVELPETSALLAALAELAPDELTKARIRRELSRRKPELPGWLKHLNDARAGRTAEMTHVLGDGDNVMAGVELATGEQLTAVIYIDHNLGTLVKDAFVVDIGLDDMIKQMSDAADDADMVWRGIDPADARARTAGAIEVAAVTYPPFESETWPASRSLVEWIVEMLPEGGTGYEHREWEAEELDAIAEQFMASPFASTCNDRDGRNLVDLFLSFGAYYGPGDPLRWSPVSVEIVLTDWIPRKVIAGSSFLLKAPNVLRAFIKFCHDQRGIRKELTDQTIAAIDEWEPEYRDLIASDNRQGWQPDFDDLSEIEDLDIASAEDDFDDENSLEALMLDFLQRAVGGPETLLTLHDEPLPDEEFDWNGIPDDISDKVGEILSTIDSGCDRWLDVEYRTACRRFLSMAASGDPDVFRRKSGSDTAAYAICWIIGKANGLFEGRLRRMTAKALMENFGVKGGSQRAPVLLAAAGIKTDSWSIYLGTPDLLTSERRRAIIEMRDRYLSELE